jgi:hypothetical protein
MSDIKLFRIGTGTVDELTDTIDTIEKSVQTARRAPFRDLIRRPAAALSWPALR